VVGHRKQPFFLNIRKFLRHLTSPYDRNGRHITIPLYRQLDDLDSLTHQVQVQLRLYLWPTIFANSASEEYLKVGNDGSNVSKKNYYG